MKILYRGSLYESVENFNTGVSVQRPLGVSAVFYNTTVDQIENIKRNGLVVSDIGDGEGFLVYTDTEYFPIDPSKTVIVSFQYKNPSNSYEILITKDIPSNSIVAIYEDWQETVNYIIDRNLVDSVKNGDFDYIFNYRYDKKSYSNKHRKAIEYVKSNY